MIFHKNPTPLSEHEIKINELYRLDEAVCLDALIKQAAFTDQDLAHIQNVAHDLVVRVRKDHMKESGLDALLYQYDLSSEEGIALMCLAEALLRVPDKATKIDLIRDKIGSADWQTHLSQSESAFVNAATWGLRFTGELLSKPESQLSSALSRFVGRSSQPVVRAALDSAMKILGKQFVMGENIKSALKRARKNEAFGYGYSYDMLGEAARTAEDAERYFIAYQDAITSLAQSNNKAKLRPGISVKLSALHPRYEVAQRDRCVPVLIERLSALAIQSKEAGLSLTVDAEEADRFMLSLDIIKAVFTDPLLGGWDGFGLAIQAYQKRTYALIDWLDNMARSENRRLMVRLVKGAYWDSEIKHSQVEGLSGYPVFTRKAGTDVSYIACAKKLSKCQNIYPQFATHNALTVASIMQIMGRNHDFEFQCLHGMGRALYDHVVKDMGYACRIYAPVGSHEDLLAYLVRRLLENGANSSFVNRIIDEKTPITELINDPITKMVCCNPKSHPRIPLPVDLYGPGRVNSKGFDVSDPIALSALADALNEFDQTQWMAKPTLIAAVPQDRLDPVFNPANGEQIGHVVMANDEEVEEAIIASLAAFEHWQHTPIERRAELLNHVGDALETHHHELIALLMREAGKTLFDAVAEVREAVDFTRYYAQQALKTLVPQILPGPTGEENILSMHGRGVIACISPWNFPLAIFLGQVTAALAAGNTVISKPATQTPLVAAKAIQLLHEAGLPQDVVQLLPGGGRLVGARLVADIRIQGVMFTGSTETAWIMNQALAARKHTIIPFIAETGGQNALISDSTALPEQLIRDVVRSAFGSAGQRCSALRVLFVQREVADKVIHMLKGAMMELQVGDPRFLSTDVGPVIDAAAKKTLDAHIEQMSNEATLIYQVEVPNELKGTYVAPSAFEIDSLDVLTEEVFGPVLHVVRYDQDDLEGVIASVNRTGFGLTAGIHSRIEHKVDYIASKLRVGNLYVNRNMTGAVVGVQPFGGEGLSGTGPKAGGPHYLLRLSVERARSTDTTASGGNATLMSLSE